MAFLTFKSATKKIDMQNFPSDAEKGFFPFFFFLLNNV